MKRDQAVRLLRAADALPEVIGINKPFHFGKPYCAIGHMLAADGYDPAEFWDSDAPYGAFRDRFGVDPADIYLVNDRALASFRRAADIAETERLLRLVGHDPAALRVADGGR